MECGIGAHSSVGYAATFSIIEKAYEATANIPININLSTTSTI
jgi:hypothetical protein